MKRYDLDGTGDLYGFPQQKTPVHEPADLDQHHHERLVGTVPGNVELDLVSAGKLPEPFFANNIRQLEPGELHEWWYERTFKAPEQLANDAAVTELVFHGIDCIADIWLNGESIGHTENALIEHRIDITHRLHRDTENTLTVRLGSPILEALKHKYDPSLATWGVGEGRLWVRKAAHSYGWDIMPRALSVGLWRSVELQIHETNEILDLYFHTRSLSPDRSLPALSPQLALCGPVKPEPAPAATRTAPLGAQGLLQERLLYAAHRPLRE